MINDEGRGNRIFKTQEMEQDHRSARNGSTRNRFCYVETGFPVEFIDNCKPKHGLEANLCKEEGYHPENPWMLMRSGTPPKIPLLTVVSSNATKVHPS